MTETTLQQWILRGVACIAVLNLVTMTSLLAAYGWHHALKPKLGRRRERQHAFERLIAHTSLDNHSAV